jgi:hypothetical protein
MRLNSVQGWIAAAGLVASMQACAAAASNQSKAPITGRTDPHAFDDLACSLEANAGGELDFDRIAAQTALDRAALTARSCQSSGTGESWTLDLTWGPDGCVRFVQVRGNGPSPAVGRCVVDIYRKAALAAFAGSPARAVVAEPGATLDLFRTGTLEPAVIQKVVRAEYDRIRSCYETGLGRNRNLRGLSRRGSLSGETGVVSHVGNAGSDLPDAGVVNCVLQIFTSLRFPEPGGRVTVLYPVMLEPATK